MGNKHCEALRIEHIIRNYVGGSRGTLCGIADADYIDVHPLIVLAVFFVILDRDSSKHENKYMFSSILDELTCIIGNERLDCLNVSKYERHSEYFDTTNNEQFIKSVIRVMEESIRMINEE